MSAAEVNLEIEVGVTFNPVFIWALNADGTGPVDLTGYSGKMEIRAARDAASPVLFVFSTANGKMALGGTAGTISLLMTATESAVLTWKRALYDIDLTSAASVVRRPMKGTVVVKGEVTR